MSARKKMIVTPTAEEAHMTDPTTAEMTDAEAIETLVRTDETHLTEDEPVTPKQISPDTDAVTRSKEVSYEGEKFHMLSQIDDGVFVAWDRCHSSSTTRHSIPDCKCKGGPTEPHYVTKWREEWIEKRNKDNKKVIDSLKKDARREVGLEPLAATVSDGIETATAAVTAASEEEHK